MRVKKIYLHELLYTEMVKSGTLLRCLNKTPLAVFAFGSNSLLQVRIPILQMLQNHNACFHSTSNAKPFQGTAVSDSARTARLSTHPVHETTSYPEHPVHETIKYPAHLVHKTTKQLTLLLRIWNYTDPALHIQAHRQAFPVPLCQQPV